VLLFLNNVKLTKKIEHYNTVQGFLQLFAKFP